MNFILAVIAAFSLLFAIILGNGAEVSNSAVTASADAVLLVIKLAGGICFWSGMMRLCEKCGICSRLKKILSPFLKLIFPKIHKNSRAFELISMNVTANLLGLGNAATPLGIAAVKELQKLNPYKNSASSEMITFIVINCSSIQILPTTLMTLRAAYNSQNPLDILPAILIVSIISLAVGILFSKFIPLLKRSKK